MSDDLRTEAAIYTERLADHLERHAGQYVVIRGQAIEHFAATYEAALDWGYERFGGDDRFFVKKVSADEDAAHFTRDLGSDLDA
jgi:hypothetical protein